MTLEQQIRLPGFEPPQDPGLKSYQTDMGDRGIYDQRNRLNDLTGREWVFSTRSVWPVKTYPRNTFRHDLRAQHGGMKPPEFCADLIRIFTKAGQRVLDPFAGVGGTLIGAAIAGRNAVGVELQERWRDIYHQVCYAEGLEPMEVLLGDSRQVLTGLDRTFDLILTDPPYWDMDTRSRSEGEFKKAGRKGRGPVKSRLTDFGNERQSLGDWRRMLLDVFRAARPLLKVGGYCLVFMGDMYHSGRYWPLTAYTATILQRDGFTDKGRIIWEDTSKDLHCYGINHQWIPSMIHQEILVFRRER